jgi:hypothetical protein
MGLDTVALIVRVEETFGIRLEDVEVAPIETLDELERLVSRKLEHDGRPDPRVFAALSRVLIEEFGVPSNLVRPSARIARDLGLD